SSRSDTLKGPRAAVRRNSHTVTHQHHHPYLNNGGHHARHHNYTQKNRHGHQNHHHPRRTGSSSYFVEFDSSRAESLYSPDPESRAESETVSDRPTRDGTEDEYDGAGHGNENFNDGSDDENARGGFLDRAFSGMSGGGVSAQHRDSFGILPPFTLEHVQIPGEGEASGSGSGGNNSHYGFFDDASLSTVKDGFGGGQKENALDLERGDAVKVTVTESDNSGNGTGTGDGNNLLQLTTPPPSPTPMRESITTKSDENETTNDVDDGESVSSLSPAVLANDAGLHTDAVNDGDDAVHDDNQSEDAPTPISKDTSQNQSRASGVNTANGNGSGRASVNSMVQFVPTANVIIPTPTWNATTASATASLLHHRRPSTSSVASNNVLLNGVGIVNANVPLPRPPPIPIAFYKLGVHMSVVESAFRGGAGGVRYAGGGGITGGRDGGIGNARERLGRGILTSEFTVYMITVKLLKPHLDGYLNSSVCTFTVYRRYSEFRLFYQFLKKQYNETVTGWPPFPKKSFFERFNPSTIAQRLSAFSNILTFVSLHPVLYNCAPLLRFLGVGSRGLEGAAAAGGVGGVIIYENSGRSNASGSGSVNFGGAAGQASNAGGSAGVQQALRRKRSMSVPV
ncbi:hypothetical protein HDU76_005887, partial [Blyttiomyces sp. JEL0837]